MRRVRLLLLMCLLINTLTRPGVVLAQWFQDPPVGMPACGSTCTTATSSFTTPGATTWTQSHNGNTFVMVDVIGGGAGGGGCDTIGQTGGGGGGAGEVKYHIPLGFVPYNTVLSLYIGTAGAAGASGNSYAGQGGEASTVSYDTVIVNAEGGSGGGKGTATAGEVAIGGDGGNGIDGSGYDSTGCGENDGALSGANTNVMFTGAGGGCGGGTGGTNDGAKACWYVSNALSCSTSYGHGFEGGGGGATMFGTGGAGGVSLISSPTAGTVGGGGGGSAKCVFSATPANGAAGGNGKISVYSLY